MLKVDKCLMANRLRIVQDKLSEIETHFESVAEAGLSISKDVYLGSAYEGARMLKDVARYCLTMAEAPEINYDVVEDWFNKFRVKVDAYITLHTGFAIVNGLTSDWKLMADVLDFTKDIAKVDHIDPEWATRMHCSSFTAEL